MNHKYLIFITYDSYGEIKTDYFHIHEETCQSYREAMILAESLGDEMSVLGRKILEYNVQELE